MECNILRLADEKPEKKQCFKTKYKNVVIVKLKDGVLFYNALSNRSSNKY